MTSQCVLELQHSSRPACTLVILFSILIQLPQPSSCAPVAFASYENTTSDNPATPVLNSATDDPDLVKRVAVGALIIVAYLIVLIVLAIGVRRFQLWWRARREERRARLEQKAKDNTTATSPVDMNTFKEAMVVTIEELDSSTELRRTNHEMCGVGRIVEMRADCEEPEGQITNTLYELPGFRKSLIESVMGVGDNHQQIDDREPLNSAGMSASVRLD